MINILVVEDNILQLNALKRIIENTETGQPICPYTASGYDEAVEIISSAHFDIFFLDILFSEDKNVPCGIDLGNYIRSLDRYRYTPIVYITSIPGQIGNAVNDIHCYNYLIKPYKREDVEKLLKSLTDSPMISASPLRIIDVNSVSHNVIVENIVMLSVSSHILTIHCDDGDLTTRQFNIDSVLAELPPYFIRVHRKYIVNRHRIDNYDRTLGFIRIESQTIPIGRTCKSEFEKRYNLT